MTLSHSLWRLTDGTRGGPSVRQVWRWCDREARRPFEVHGCWGVHQLPSSWKIRSVSYHTFISPLPPSSFFLHFWDLLLLIFYFKNDFSVIIIVFCFFFCLTLDMGNHGGGSTEQERDIREDDSIVCSHLWLGYEARYLLSLLCLVYLLPRPLSSLISQLSSLLSFLSPHVPLSLCLLLCSHFESSLVISSFPLSPCPLPSYLYISLIPIHMQLGRAPSSTAGSCTSSKKQRDLGSTINIDISLWCFETASPSLMPQATATSSGTWPLGPPRLVFPSS